MNTLTFTRFEPLGCAGREALNTLCTNLSLALAPGSGGMKLMITSCRPDEGKTFVSMNMMRALAELGKSAVWVDADLRHSVASARYGMEIREGKPRGMTHYLSGMCSADDILYATNIKGAYAVPVRQTVSNSLPLLITPRLPLLLNSLARDHDMVLVDAPPIGELSDAAEIARHCDGTVLVVAYHKISGKELYERHRQIERAGCKVLGVALNKVTCDSIHSQSSCRRTHRVQKGEGGRLCKRKKQ